MSKSRGTLISAHSVIEAGLNPEWFRYYFATKLNASMEDLDLNLQDFVARVNSDLLGKYINIASRSAGFLVKRFMGRVSDSAMAHPLLSTITNANTSIAELYESREYAKAIRQVMELADLVNGFVDENKPWDLAKDPARSDQLHEVCSVILEFLPLLEPLPQARIAPARCQCRDFLGSANNAMARYPNPLAEQFADSTLQTFDDAG